MSETSYPKHLRLAPGDRIEARFVRLERGKFFDRASEDLVERPIAILELDGEERSLWLHETALRGRFVKAKPVEGERVVIAKSGEKLQSQSSGYRYWGFEVECPDREPEAPLAWDDPLLGGDDDPQRPLNGDSAADDDNVPF